MNVDILINAIGDFMLQLSSVSAESPAVGFCILGIMPIILIGGAILKTGK